jgi:hypothetical protein
MSLTHLTLMMESDDEESQYLVNRVIGKVHQIEGTWIGQTAMPIRTLSAPKSRKQYKGRERAL